MTDRHTRQESISEKNEREQAMTAIGSGNQLLKDAAKGVRGTVRASKRQGETGRGKGGGGGGGGGGGSGGGGTKGASGSGVQTSGGEGSGRGKGNNHRHSSGGRGSGSHDVCIFKDEEIGLKYALY